MFWQQKLFNNDRFALRLGQSAGTCTLNPDGTTACPAPVTPVAPSQSQASVIPWILGGAAILAAAAFLK